MDLIGRKWMMKKGATFGAFVQEMRDFQEANKGAEGFEKEFEYLGRALDAYLEIQMAIGGYFGNKQYGLSLIHISEPTRPY